VRIDAFDVLDPAAARQQVLVHAQLHFAADLQVGGEEHVQRDLDGALPRVFHRHHAEVGVAASTSWNTSSMLASGKPHAPNATEMLLHPPAG
jgi:hypothetical protein